MKKGAIQLLWVLIALSACEKEVEWPPDGPPPKLIIADAIIIDRMGQQPVTLAYPVASLDATPEPVTGAVVRITTIDSSWLLSENPAGSGRYLTGPGFIAGLGKSYTLFISKDEVVYSAKAGMVAGQEFAALQWARNSTDSLFHVDYVASAFDANSPAMWELLLDWSHVPGYWQSDSAKCRARMLFYTLPTLDVSEIFSPVVESVSFPAGTIIEQRRYSLSAGHAAFIREMLLVTSWSGGFFSAAPAAVSTNLSSGAAGYFGACAMTSLSVTVTP